MNRPTAAREAADRWKHRIEAYHRAFLSDAGQTVMEELSRLCLEHRTTMVGNSERMTCFNEGKRFVMLHIREMLAADPNRPRAQEAIAQETIHG